MKNTECLCEICTVVAAGSCAEHFAVDPCPEGRAVSGYGTHHVLANNGIEHPVHEALRPWERGEEIVAVLVESEAKVLQRDRCVAATGIGLLEVHEVGDCKRIAFPDQVGHGKSRTDAKIVAFKSKSSFEPGDVSAVWYKCDVMRSGEVFPDRGGCVVNAAADIPLTVPVCDESIRYIWCLPDESNFFGDFHVC